MSLSIVPPTFSTGIRRIWWRRVETQRPADYERLRAGEWRRAYTDDELDALSIEVFGERVPAVVSRPRSARLEDWRLTKETAAAAARRHAP